jgi:two-component system sensor histidine kinase PilS (NtrC family)
MAREEAVTIRGQLRILIIVRLALVTLVSVVALSTSVFGPSTAQFLRLFLPTVCVLSGIYFLFLSYTNRPLELFNLQFFSDLVLVSLLIYSSGGTVSPFTSLYVLIIVYASVIRHRKGAVWAVTLSIISYVGLAHLEYFRSAEPIAVYSQFVYRILWNIVGFVSVALLGSYLSERLQKTRLELGVIKMLHDNIVDSIRTGLITVDLEGRITSVNGAACDILGRDAAQLRNQPLNLLFPDAILETIRNADFKPPSRPVRAESWLPHPRRQHVFVGMSCSPLLAKGGEQIGHILSFQDLTEIRRREEELQLKEKMAAIGQVAAGVAHEIRNPLAALSGSVQILRAELDLLPEQKRLIEIALRECNRLNQTVADFLTYAGPPPPRFQLLNLVSLVEETLGLFEKNPERESHHRVEFSADSQQALCLVDPDQIRQAVWNVLQNAIRAMPNGGTVRVRIAADGGQTRLSIGDDGVGMTEEQQSKIFQPFQSGFKKGVGLGMAIVYQIVQQHNGHIAVDSRPEQGTMVSISFPLTDRGATAGAPQLEDRRPAPVA